VTIPNPRTLRLTSVLVGSGLLVACVDNGHVLGETVPRGAGGDAGSPGSIGAANPSGGNERTDAGHAAGTNVHPSGGKAGSSAPPEGGWAGSSAPNGGVAETGGVSSGTGGTWTGTGATGGRTGGTGGTATGGTCEGGEGGNLSIPFEQADQYACCSTSEDCHVLWTNCSCAAVSTQVSELESVMICGTNSCLAPDRTPSAACQNGQCSLRMDYACTGTLDEVLGQVSTDCPATYGATDAWLRSCAGVTGLHWTSGYSGSCNGYSAAEVSWGTHGQTCYYDETSGELVGALVFDDVPTYCEGASSSMVGGEYPAACPVPDLTFRGACNCNDLDNVGTDVTPVDTDVEIPTGEGGTLVLGTYVLTDVRTYAGSSVAGELPVMRQTLVLTGDGGLFVNLEEGTTTRSAFEVSVVGTTATFTTTCTTDPSSFELPTSSFTADATAITLYSTSLGMSVTYTAYDG
jgi:hypothetical protein